MVELSGIELLTSCDAKQALSQLSYSPFLIGGLGRTRTTDLTYQGAL